MSLPRYNRRVVDQGLAWLSGGFRSQPNIRAWLAVLLRPWQDLEDATWGVLGARFLATATLNPLPATNPVLDVIGDLVGQSRFGLDDASYQSIIYLRVAVNRATGRTTDWAGFAKILLRAGAGGPVSFYELSAGFFFGVWDENLNPNLIAMALRRAAPNGVYGVFGYSTWPDGDDFEWCDAGDIAGSGQGTWDDAIAGGVGSLLVSGVEI